jgi:hypothetical protein
MAKRPTAGLAHSRILRGVVFLARSLASLLVALVIGLKAQSAWAKPAQVRTHITPGIGAEARLTPAIALALQAQMRIVDVAGPFTHEKKKDGVFLRTALALRLNELMGAELGYAYGYGVFPVEGIARQEHRGEIGFRVGASGESGFSLMNRLRLDVRILEEVRGKWVVRARPRNEVRLNYSIAPPFSLALTTEVLAQGPWSMRTWLGLRGGVVAHGRFGLGSNAEGEPRAYLQWHFGDQLAFWPLAVGRVGKTLDPVFDALQPGQANDVGAYLENVLGGGLSLLF